MNELQKIIKEKILQRIQKRFEENLEIDDGIKQFRPGDTLSITFSFKYEPVFQKPK